MDCYFCGKNATKIKKFHVFSGVKNMCGQCYSIHKLLKGQTVDSVLKMINAMDEHTCYTCVSFVKSREGNCRGGKLTGIGSHTSKYPFTYANHGCGRFEKVEKSI